MKEVIDDLSRKNRLEQTSLKRNAKGTSLDRYVLENNISGTTFTPVKNNSYYVANVSSPSTIVIDNIVVPNYKENMIIKFSLQVPSTNITHSITFKNANNILTPNNKDFVISTSNGNNEMIVVLECVGEKDQKFRVVSGMSRWFESWKTPTLLNNWVNYGG